MADSINRLTDISRHAITPTNIRELKITEDILNDPSLVARDAKGQSQKPIGVSINETPIAGYSSQSASERGWFAYMNLGAPLIKERSDVAQPAPERVASSSYTNRDSSPSKFLANVGFSLGNSTTWSITGEARLSFQVRGMEFSEQTTRSMVWLQTMARASHQSGSVDVTFHTEGEGSQTVHDEAEFLARLELALMGTVSGTVTARSDNNSEVSGTIPANSRIRVLSTQRRKRRVFEYTIPVTFSGSIAVQYGVPVAVLPYGGGTGPQATPPNYQEVVARNFAGLSTLNTPGADYTQVGIAESVSSVDIDHEVFASETFQAENPRIQPYN